MTFILENNTAIPCECRESLLARDLLKKSGISTNFAQKTFDNFDYTKDVQLLSAYKQAKLYVRDFTINECDKANSIMFLGQVGSGKTHLSLAIANDLLNKNIGVVYMSYREIITRLKQNIMDEVYYHKLLGTYKNARVLLIDDLFKGKVSESDLNILFELINFRYFNKKPMIVSSEMSIEDILNLDEAIGSRMYEMCSIVRLKGRKLNHRIYE